jgi:hypothetical protein
MSCASSTLKFFGSTTIIATPKSQDSQDPDRAFTENFFPNRAGFPLSNSLEIPLAH